ncbi:MAG: S-adenosylhomocysteine deaminase [Nitrospirae bacterium CG_4_10_14_0_8_um_filter_41_23]|nr:amidohydrolase [Nitrospirota bacterium]OIP61175.1 MAG: S-adenosylhomocysteine deaminase [Nitrospirae bacterium CG2_30_41_42]PIQ94414.1 MAG: S-adenosylhomocysteine deaminase [Nitrospirae bacterium CG11_big_fil_rev_8_21_14_0_20_41_14]PIV41805.1 MAG: S-adenosylhomocysteine deaminase [Nitrospirae bacterium CG02_land_8_20_14_3_00_41_53]PIW86326.1 MAG: S-adenosylhomocysteine deaminase [Nitrospirae bacterium CG_4_8_14_3_um_filter_41_47]PIY86938.1 MAG: S-adenosylhomocysteine deaminase [Nitrospirae 
MQDVDYIICGDYVLPMDEGLTVIKDGAIAVSGTDILEVGTSKEILKKYTSEAIIMGEGKAVFPGLINTHTHAAMVYFRGIADDIPLTDWLKNHIWPAENRWLSPEFISDAVELACLEMLKGGVTTYNDMYFYEDAAGKSTKRMGMRAVLGSGILDFPSKSASTTDEYFVNAESFIKNWKGDELITPCIAPHALYTCGPESLKRARHVADKYDIPIHIHLSETRWEVNEIKNRFMMAPVEYLDSIGFLDERVLAAHCVWMTDGEIKILSQRRIGVSHCIESNLKLASGIAPVVKMLNAGVKVTFGTDGAASNNDLNILSEMSTAAKVHKALSNNPTVLDAKTILLMATRWSAEVLGLGDKIGSIEKGKMADIVTINLKKPHLTPIYNVYSHIVYAAMASDVETVMVNGKVVVNEGRLCNADEEEILIKASGWQKKIKA